MSKTTTTSKHLFPVVYYKFNTGTTFRWLEPFSLDLLLFRVWVSFPVFIHEPSLVTSASSWLLRYGSCESRARSDCNFKLDSSFLCRQLTRGVVAWLVVVHFSLSFYGFPLPVLSLFTYFTMGKTPCRIFLVRLDSHHVCKCLWETFWWKVDLYSNVVLVTKNGRPVEKERVLCKLS